MENVSLIPALDSNTESRYHINYNGKNIGAVSVCNVNPGLLLTIFIDAPYRRKGIGRYILDKLKVKRLECTTWNELGISFYNSLGFKQVSKDNYLIQFQKDNLCQFKLTPLKIK